MNAIQAAQDTMELAEKVGFDKSDLMIAETDVPHIKEMIQKMNPTDMSIGKVNRWLGWIQACIVIRTGGKVSLEDCKQINLKNS